MRKAYSAGIVRVCGMRERNVLICVFEHDILISYLQENIAALLQRLVDEENNRCLWTRMDHVNTRCINVEPDDAQ
jgi:hypothetical protein